MEVFSSAQITTSFGPNGWPSQIPAYRSSTRAALTAKSGSRIEIQDRCCHGLRASAASHRRTDDAGAPTWQRMPSSRAVGQAVEPLDGEPAPPGPHGVHTDVAGPRDPRVRHPMGSVQDDLGA